MCNVVTCHNKEVANPSIFHPENFRSEEQLDQLLEMAQEVIRKGNWHPSYAMIDKSQAEYNALKNGQFNSLGISHNLLMLSY